MFSGEYNALCWLSFNILDKHEMYQLAFIVKDQSYEGNKLVQTMNVGGQKQDQLSSSEEMNIGKGKIMSKST